MASVRPNALLIMCDCDPDGTVDGLLGLLLPDLEQAIAQAVEQHGDATIHGDPEDSGLRIHTLSIQELMTEAQSPPAPV